MRSLSLKGALAEKRKLKLELAAKAGRLVTELGGLALPLSVRPLGELPVDEISAAAEELKAVKAQYQILSAEMAEIEAELG